MNELTFQVIILAIPLILTVATFYITKAINVYVDKEMLSNLILNKAKQKSPTSTGGAMNALFCKEIYYSKHI